MGLSKGGAAGGGRWIAGRWIAGRAAGPVGGSRTAGGLWARVGTRECGRRECEGVGRGVEGGHGTLVAALLAGGERCGIESLDLNIAAL